MPNSDNANDGEWHLDKRIPIGLMIGLTLNLGLGIWYASKLDSRITYLEAGGTRTDRLIDKIQEGNDQTNTRLTRVEDRAESILDIVKQLAPRQTNAPANR